jgi:Secretion system C-terminal sorting domain
MKAIILTSLITVLQFITVHSQTTPQFIMPFWFEDAVGNKDTIWVGSDTSASSSNINTQFGEVLLTTPFDSVFEVRGVHGDDSQWRTLKLLIENADHGVCPLPSYTRIMIHAKHTPVTISWDTTLLSAIYPCNINAVLSPTNLPFLLQHWWKAPDLHCMMTKTELVTNLIDQSSGGNLVHAFQIEGKGLVNLRGYYYIAFWDLPHCYTTLPVSENLPHELSICYPNPASNMLQLKFPTTVQRLRVFDMYGKQCYQDTTPQSETKIELTSYPVGMYQVQWENANGTIGQTRFQKLE